MTTAGRQQLLHERVLQRLGNRGTTGLDCHKNTNETDVQIADMTARTTQGLARDCKHTRCVICRVIAKSLINQIGELVLRLRALQRTADGREQGKYIQDRFIDFKGRCGHSVNET